MIGILMITHEELGDSLIRCAYHMLGEQPQQLRALAVRSNDEPDVLLQKAQVVIREMHESDGILVLSDMFGGTPCNIAMKLTHMDNVKGLSGLNLPMLITALNFRHLPLDECLNKTRNNGQESIVHFNETGCVDI